MTFLITLIVIILLIVYLKHDWSTGSWSKCTNNTQNRTVICETVDDVTCDDSSCTSTKPSSSQSCTPSPFPSKCDWVRGSWGNCMNKTQTRTVTCENTEGIECNESSCTSSKPSSSQNCTNTNPECGDGNTNKCHIPQYCNDKQKCVYNTQECDSKHICPSNNTCIYDYSGGSISGTGHCANCNDDIGFAKGSLVWIMNMYDTKTKTLYGDIHLEYDDNIDYSSMCPYIDQDGIGNGFIFDSATFCIEKNKNNTFNLIGKIRDPDSDYNSFKLVDKTKNIYLSELIGNTTFKAYLQPYGCTLPTQT